MKIKSLFRVSIICFLFIGASAEAEDTVTGLCKDGTSYTGASKKGACRGHKGIKEWYADKVAPAEATKVPATKAASPAMPEKEKKAAEAPATGPATGVCKDGTPLYRHIKKRRLPRAQGHQRMVCRQQAPAVESIPEQKKYLPLKPHPQQNQRQLALLLPVYVKTGRNTQALRKEVLAVGIRASKNGMLTKQAPSAKEVAPATVAPPLQPLLLALPLNRQYQPQSRDQVKYGSIPVQKFYHCEGSKFYGNTKEGEYMSEADAQAKGYNPNRKKFVIN